MKTTKPISTISFNSKDYLILKLEELRKAKKIAFWAFVPHLPEDDEGGKKDHHHVYIEPACSVQTEDIREALKEFDPLNPSKPLGCLTFYKSNFDDWFLYAIHDAAYLRSKQQSRVHHYTEDDVLSSDPDDLNFHVKKIDRIGISPWASMEDAQNHNVTFDEWFSRGTAPIQQIKQFRDAWVMLARVRAGVREVTWRDDRLPHAMVADYNAQMMPNSAFCDEDGVILDQDERTSKNG